MSRDLYDLARRVTDEVMGEGTYAEVNRGNPDPSVQATIQRGGGQVSATYFSTAQRREALRKWLQRELRDGSFKNAREIEVEASDIYTRLYGMGGSDNAKCRRDISALVKEGFLEKVDYQYRLVTR